MVRALRSAYTPVLRWGACYRKAVFAQSGSRFWRRSVFSSRAGFTDFLPALEEGNLDIHASDAPDNIT